VKKTSVLSLDAGTSSVRALLFDVEGAVLAEFRRAVPLDFPENGWVEQSAGQLWQALYECLEQALHFARTQGIEVKCAGLTNQRETVVAWDKSTGRALAPAIVWQDRRTTEACEALKNQGLETEIRHRTGLGLDPYFSAGKMAWLLQNNMEVERAANRGTLALGTVDSWLMFQLLGKHFTEASNASRTSLYNLEKGNWDSKLLELWNINRVWLPEILPSDAKYGTIALAGLPEIPLTGVLGDQQASLLGQGCLHPGATKNTYGTGCFIMQQAGSTRPESGKALLSTLAWETQQGRFYALEGSVFMAGSLLNWLSEELHLADSMAGLNAMAESVPNSGGVILVPAFTGLGAPYWSPRARGTWLGLNAGTGKAELIRSAFDAIAHQTADVLEHMEKLTGIPAACIWVDGGASASDVLMQRQADLAEMPVLRSPIQESTAWGVAVMAGQGAGLWDLDRAENPKPKAVFSPNKETNIRAERQRWKHAIQVCLNWKG
jgi:glycerol kinase